MKNIIKTISLLAFLAVIVVSCNTKPKLRMPDIIRGAKSFDQVPSIKKDLSASANFDAFNLGTSTGKLVVDVKDASVVSNCKLMVAYNGDFSKAVIYKDIPSFPTSVSVSPTQLVSLVSALNSLTDIKPGDKFTFYLSYDLNGTHVNTFMADGTPDLGPGLTVIPGISISVDYSVVCPLILSDFVGNYSVEDWENGTLEATSTATVALNTSGDSLIISGLLNNSWWGLDPTTIIVTINPVTLEIEGPDQVVYPNAFGYGPLTMADINGPANTCDKVLKITGTFNVSAGSFGTDTFIMTKTSKKSLKTGISRTSKRELLYRFD